MTTEDYPKELKEKIKALKENIQQQIKDITTEYANISEKKIKREIFGKHGENALQFLEDEDMGSSIEDNNNASEEQEKEYKDASRHFKDQCKKIYELSVQLYREDGIHVLAYCVPSPEEPDIRPLKVFNTKLCKRFHNKLLKESIKISNELKAYIADRTISKKHKKILEQVDSEPPAKRKKLDKQELKKGQVKKETIARKQTKLENFFKQGEKPGKHEEGDNFARIQTKKEIRKRMLDMLLSADPELKESVFPWKSFGESRSHKKCIMEGLPIDAVDLGKGLDRMTTSEINILVNGIENGTIRIRKVE
ncbi:hypothetical protein G6F37_001459 [Rhizopus arrhizus]|nr:hypothetical protein G6F38_002158 [Rhizopus arrhizus]KAG1163168.1 hypothetical protein G6F37_001459 [Rhizopus arrhizus]